MIMKAKKPTNASVTTPMAAMRAGPSLLKKSTRPFKALTSPSSLSPPRSSANGNERDAWAIFARFRVSEGLTSEAFSKA